MAYTIRNLIQDAFRESGVIGRGMDISPTEQSEALSSLNLILDEVYASGDNSTTISRDVTFTGEDVYTVGPMPVMGSGDPVPDFPLDFMPLSIDQIIVTLSNSRIPARLIDPITYFNRPIDKISNPAPISYYFERTYPLGTIRFLEGTPSGPGELIYKPSMVDVGINTDYKIYPRGLRPFLVYKLAEFTAVQNGFDAMALVVKANNAWNSYKLSTYEGQAYQADGSAPGADHYRYNIYGDV